MTVAPLLREALHDGGTKSFGRACYQRCLSFQASHSLCPTNPRYAGSVSDTFAPAAAAAAPVILHGRISARLTSIYFIVNAGSMNFFTTKAL